MEFAIRVLAEAFEAMGVEFFSPHEFVKNEWGGAPPMSMLSHILPTVLVLDEARRDVGPIRINSGYRSRGHNTAVGGYPDSWHMRNAAADAQPLESTAEALHDWFEASIFAPRLALGRYDSFVHVDCRHWVGMPEYGATSPTRWTG